MRIDSEFLAKANIPKIPLKFVVDNGLKVFPADQPPDLPQLE